MNSSTQPSMYPQDPCIWYLYLRKFSWPSWSSIGRYTIHGSDGVVQMIYQVPPNFHPNLRAMAGVRECWNHCVQVIRDECGPAAIWSDPNTPTIHRRCLYRYFRSAIDRIVVKFRCIVDSDNILMDLAYLGVFHWCVLWAQESCKIHKHPGWLWQMNSWFSI